MRGFGRTLCILGLGFSLGASASSAGEPIVPALAEASNPNCPPRCIPAPYCPQPQPGVAPAPTPEQPPTPQPSPLAETALAPESALALGGETFAAAPNMIGHLLMGSRSVSFR